MLIIYTYIYSLYYITIICYQSQHVCWQITKIHAIVSTIIHIYIYTYHIIYIIIHIICIYIYISSSLIILVSMTIDYYYAVGTLLVSPWLTMAVIPSRPSTWKTLRTSQTMWRTLERNPGLTQTIYTWVMVSVFLCISRSSWILHGRDKTITDAAAATPTTSQKTKAHSH